MLTTLFLGIILTFGTLGLLWLGFTQLRKWPRFDAFNSRQANKRMLQLTLAIYVLGFVATIYLMLN
jgi:threonine/homoserine/homoserine lactone efflux protein